MAGQMSKGPNFPQIPLNDQLLEWMWWRWKFSSTEGKWNIDAKLDSPSPDTPGLVYLTPNETPGILEPSLTYDWWWIPHITDPATGNITTHGKLYVRDTSKVNFNTDPNCEDAGGEWQEITLRTNSDPSLRGERGKTIWADYGIPELDLLIDGTRPENNDGPPGPGDSINGWPYSGDVDDLLGDMYLDLDGMKLYGPKYTNPTTDLAIWGDGISILGPEWAKWQGSWKCDHGQYNKAPHDCVSHRQYNKDIVETWICTQSHTPTCISTSGQAHVLGCQFEEIIGDEFYPSACGSTNDFFYFRHQKDSNTSNDIHYWFMFSCQKWMGDGGQPGTYWGDSEAQPSSGIITFNPSGNDGQGTSTISYDAESNNHVMVNIRLGGPDHGKFRFKTYNPVTNIAAWQYNQDGNWWSFNTDYFNHDNYSVEDERWRMAWHDRCTIFDTSDGDYVGMWADLDGDGIRNYEDEGATGVSVPALATAFVHVCNGIDEFLEGTYADDLPWDFRVGRGADGSNIHGMIAVLDYGAGTETNYPKFMSVTQGMTYYQAQCNDTGGNEPDDCPSGQTVINRAQWGVYRNYACPGSGRYWTMDYETYLADSVVTIYEPYDGSPYWERMLGAQTKDFLRTNEGYYSWKDSGVQFNFGGFTPVVYDYDGLGVQDVRWRDYKTYEQWPGGKKAGESDIRMGETHQGTPSAESISCPKPDINTSTSNIKEWGLPPMETTYAGNRWWRLMGRNWDGNPKATGTVSGWEDHGDTLRISNGSGGTTNISIPTNFICLKPGNKYKITMGGYVKPQLGPVTTDTSTPLVGSTVFRRDSSVSDSENPLDDFTGGWYEMMLTKIPLAPQYDSSYGLVDPYNTEKDLRSVNYLPTAPWFTPLNPWLRGIAPPKEYWAEQESATTGNLVDPSDNILSLSWTFTKEDVVEHDSYLEAAEANIGWTGSDLDHIKRYQGSQRPTGTGWDGSTSSWVDQGADGTYLRTNGKYMETSVIYSPSSEGSPGSPGDCWIGLYWDASWWAPHCQAQRDLFHPQTFTGEYVKKGTIGIYPDEPFGYEEINPATRGNTLGATDFNNTRGGFVRIEIIEEGD